MAISWTIASELFRRHHREGLTVRIRRPHQYVCVSLERDGDVLALLSSSLAMPGAGRAPTWDDRGYLDAALTEPGLPAVIDDIEGGLGLGPWQPPHGVTTPPVLIIRVIAALAQRFAFGTRRFRAECGYLDCDGDTDAIQPWVATVGASVHQRAVRAIEEGQPAEALRLAGSIWGLLLIGGAGPSDISLVLDAATGIATPVDSPGASVSLVELYDRCGRRLGPVADRVAELLCA